MILEDTRSPNPEIHAILVAGVAVEPTNLGSADYMWYDREQQSVGVERKTASDFLSSIRDGRLGDPGLGADGLPKDELVRMKQMYDHAVLIVEGLLWSDAGKIIHGTSLGRYLYYNKAGGATLALNVRRTQWRTTAILAVLWSYTRYLGVETYFAGNAAMTGELLLQGYISDQASSHGVPKASFRYHLERVSEKQKFYMDIPGVGPILAAKLDNTFGSVLELLQATKEELQVVLGDKKGERVYTWLRH